MASGTPRNGWGPGAPTTAPEPKEFGADTPCREGYSGARGAIVRGNLVTW